MKKGTKKSELIAPREKFYLLLNNTKEYAILVLDLQGRIEDWNKGAQHLLGFSAKEIV